MPVFRSRTVLEATRNLRAFLGVEAGVTRGPVPDSGQGRGGRVGRPRRQLSAKDRRLTAMENAGPRELPGAGTPGGEPGEGGVDTYERLYEAHARSHTAEEAIGGSFDLVGRLELGVLMVEGLRPTDTLVDLGCGTGRLAVHAIPALPDGRYVGIDISDSMLREARERVRGIAGAGQCSVSWVKQTGPVFALETGSVDVICAFSVFTHMEHEDTYRYLKNALRIVRPGGRFVFSCLPMNLKLARVVFLQSAADDLQTRWSKVRNVTTSVEMMTTIAELAGWTPLRWYDGEEENIPLPETGEKHSLGQSVCILEAPRENRAGSA